MIVLMRKYLVPEMAQLSEDDCSSLRQSEIIEKSRFLKGTDFDALAVSAQKIGTETLSYRDYLYLAQTARKRRSPITLLLRCSPICSR